MNTLALHFTKRVDEWSSKENRSSEKSNRSTRSIVRDSIETAKIGIQRLGTISEVKDED